MVKVPSLYPPQHRRTLPRFGSALQNRLMLRLRLRYNSLLVAPFQRLTSRPFPLPRPPLRLVLLHLAVVRSNHLRSELPDLWTDGRRPHVRLVRLEPPAVGAQDVAQEQVRLGVQFRVGGREGDGLVGQPPGGGYVGR